MLRRIRRLVPLSGPAVVALAWRNRHTIADWAGFAARGARSLVERRAFSDDVRAEARLRYALIKDRTAAARDVDIAVRGGVAVLRGRVPREVHPGLLATALATPGVCAVDDSALVVAR